MAPPVANVPELSPAPAPTALVATLPAAQVTFALTPAKHNDGILDYGSVEGRKLYTTATAALTIKIDVSPHQTLMLLTEMSRKSYDNGWGICGKSHASSTPMEPSFKPMIYSKNMAWSPSNRHMTSQLLTPILLPEWLRMV